MENVIKQLPLYMSIKKINIDFFLSNQLMNKIQHQQLEYTKKEIETLFKKNWDKENHQAILYKFEYKTDEEEDKLIEKTKSLMKRICNMYSRPKYYASRQFVIEILEDHEVEKTKEIIKKKEKDQKEIKEMWIIIQDEEGYKLSQEIHKQLNQ